MKRSFLLDLLRVLAISMVFLAHFDQELDWPVDDFFGIKNFYYVSFGGVGVSVFLVLSGILAGLTDGRKELSYPEYMTKKVLRIYPLYWMSVIVSIGAFIWAGWIDKGKVPDLFPNGVLTDIIGSVTGFYSWMGLWGGPFNSPGWFIGLIMVMYAVFPAMLWLMKKNKHIVIIVLLAISIASRYYIGDAGLPFEKHNIFDHFVNFFYKWYGFLPGRPVDWFPLNRVFEFGFGVYLALVIKPDFWFKLKVKGAVIITWLSDQSFALFLVHYPFMFLIHTLAKKGLHISIAIILYLVFVLAVGFALNIIDGVIPRKSLTSFLFGNKPEK